ncbi:MAG TPA: flippase [bacterium]|nr:flippase [bacterium]
MSKIWLNTAWKLGALTGSKLLVFALMLVAARWLPLDDFGYLVFVLAYSQLAFVVLDAGVSTALWREASTANDRGLRGYIAAHALRPWSLPAGLAVALLMLGLFDLPPNVVMFAAMVLLGVAIESLTQLDLALFKARENLRHEALVSLLQRLVFVGLALVALVKGFSLLGVGVAYLAGQMAALWYSRRLHPRPLAPFRDKQPQAMSLAKLALPLAAVNIFTVVYFRIDLVMLQKIAGAEQAGLYGAAYRLIEAAMMLPAAFLTAYFPRLARYAEGNGEKVAVAAPLRLLVSVVTAGTAFGLVFAPEVLRLLFAERFVVAAWALRILLLAMWLIFPNYLLTNMLVARREQKSFARFVGICALVNVALNAVLIPLCGMLGAATATVATEGLLLLLCWRHLRANEPALVLRNLIYPLHYGAGFAIVLFVAERFAPNGALAGGFAVLLFWCAMAFRKFHRREAQ